MVSGGKKFRPRWFHLTVLPSVVFWELFPDLASASIAYMQACGTAGLDLKPGDRVVPDQQTGRRIRELANLGRTSVGVNVQLERIFGRFPGLLARVEKARNALLRD